MKAHEFCYWLQGYFELRDGTNDTLSAAQVDVIKSHLNMVFFHDIDNKYPKEQQAVLNELHKPTPPFFKKYYENGEEILYRC